MSMVQLQGRDQLLIAQNEMLKALIASSVSKGNYRSVKDITYFVLTIGFVMGVTLAAILGVSFGSIVTLFTKDIGVLAIARTGVLFVSASQPLNAFAFIVDGLHYGVSDFPYAAYSMVCFFLDMNIKLHICPWINMFSL
ncbi:protein DETOXIFICATION 45, chloroplastic-like isoform X2 [Lactuca sativa]|uniref:protein DETOXIFICATION 45, chloroplastic-like isoform X2 n=1 Tax=Lactuca sativa TaxID=4236 RepID=UPI0022AF8361|nr:protein DETOXIFICATION 45, chloroplastic-like isoform X2 [Lactuca sativa]